MLKGLIEIILIALIYGIFSGMIPILSFRCSSKKQEAAPINNIEIKPRKIGEFNEYKFFREDQIIKDRIKEKMGDGFYDDYLIGTILNVSKTGVENILEDCDCAVRHYSDKGNRYLSEKENSDRVMFFEECVALCKNRLLEIDQNESKIDE